MNDYNNLIKIANDTMNQLNILWDELGIEGEERKEEIQKLMTDVSLVYISKVKSIENIRDTLKKKITSTLQWLNKMIIELGESNEIDFNNLFLNFPLKKRFEKLSEEFEILKKKRITRINKINELQEKLYNLWKELGLYESVLKFAKDPKDSRYKFFIKYDNEISFENINSEPFDLTLTTIKEFEEEIKFIEQEKLKRINYSTQLRNEIVELWSDLCALIETSNQLHQDILNENINKLLNPNIVKEMENLKQKLLMEKQYREEEIKRYAIEITCLWDKLKISQEERDNFFRINTGLGPQVVKACQEELNRLSILRTNSIKQLILDARESIKTLWDELHYSNEERVLFHPAFSNEFTEQVLEEHENEIIRLQNILETIKPIIKLVEKRETILKEKEEFEMTSKDPNRLLTKKSGRDPGRLLREEKMRRTIEKELPKLEEKIKKTIKEWEDLNNEIFIYNGKKYLEEMELEQQKEKEKKEQEKLKKEQQTMNLNNTLETPIKKINIKNNLNLTTPNNKIITPNKTPKQKNLRSILSPLNGNFSEKATKKRNNLNNGIENSPFKSQKQS